MIRFIQVWFFYVLFIIIITLSGCEGKKTPGLDGFKVENLPIKCQIYILTIDAIKNNDGSGLTKNKDAEKNMTLAAVFANPCLDSLTKLENNEKQKLMDQISSLKVENAELKAKLDFLSKSISDKIK